MRIESNFLELWRRKLTSIALRSKADGTLAAVQSINKETAICKGISLV